MSHRGSLGYQMMKALQGIFRPGHSRHEDKKYGRIDVIRGIRTMRDMCKDVHRFGHFVREHWPEVREVGQVTPAMAQAYIEELAGRGLSRGYVKRVEASLRKLDLACRKARIFPPERPELLPLGRREPHTHTGQTVGPHAYDPLEVERLLEIIHGRDPLMADLLKLMWIAGLRISEVSYLRAEDIHPEEAWICLESNANRTKGGRPRRVIVQSDQAGFLAGMRQMGLARPDGHLFPNRRTLVRRACWRVRSACAQLGIDCLGTHGFRRSFAAQEYRRAVEAGASDRQALLAVSHQLGHNRVSVAARSYVPSEMRVRPAGRHALSYSKNLEPPMGKIQTTGAGPSPAPG